MKKGLLSILAGALLVVGCQNYDDQFDNLESQISALASTVAGLSQVQSDLSSLAGTVSSLSSTVAGLGSAIDTAVANGLADITADIADLEAALDGVANSSDLADLTEAVADAQSDLDDLLANSSVFTGEVTINNQSTLDAFHAMGSTLAIVNGKVDITVDTTMDIVKVQAVVDQILTTTKDFSYTATSADVTGVTFNKLSGTQTLTLKQADGYEAKSLVSAGNIVLNNAFASKVDIVDLRSLTTVVSLSDGTAGQLDFSNAAEIHLTKLAYYAGGNLTLKGKKDGVIDISALTDTNSANVVAPFTLTIDGPKSFTSTTIAGDSAASSNYGQIILSNVETVSISDFGGKITLADGVEKATLNDVAISPVITNATDLITLSIEGVTKYGKTHTASGATAQAATLHTTSFISLGITSSHSDLTSLTVTGKFNDVNIDNADSITEVHLDALTANTVDVENLDDLTTLTTAASKINDLDLVNNDDLLETALDYDTYTTVVASGGTADAKGDLNVTGNAKLASLTVHVKSMNDLDITSNPKLATISFPFLVAAGIGTTPDVDIKGNAFVASSATDNYDATAAGAEIKTGTTDDSTNTGSYTSTSGISTLKTWLDAAVAAGTSAANAPMQVWFDTVEELKSIDVNGTVTTTNPGANTTQDSTKAATVWAAVYVVPKVTEASTMDGAVAGETRSFVFDLFRDGLGNVKALGTGEGARVKWGSGSDDYVDFKQSTDPARLTVQSLVDYMNADTSLASAGLKIEAAIDSAEKYIYTISYLTTTNGVNSAGVVSNTADGNVYATFGTGWDGALIELSAPVKSTDNAAVTIADEFRADIDARAEYNAVSITTGPNANKSFYVTRNVSGTATRDLSPLMAATPKLDIVIDAAMASTTAILGADVAGFRTASHLSNTFATSRYSLPDVTPVKQSNLRITLRDTSGLGMNSSVTMTAATAGVSNTAISTTTGANEGQLFGVALVDGVNIVSASSNVSSGTTDATATTYYVAAAAAAGTKSVSTAGVTAITTDRTGWL